MHLEWDEQKYRTGFEHIDDQHRNLFDGLNGLTAFLKNSSAADDPVNQGKILDMLNFLGEYAGKHFRDEEAVFEQYNHPMAALNREEHEAFVKQYVEYHAKLTTGTFSRALLIQLNIYLRSWTVNHIVKVDTALCECAEKAGLSSSTGHHSHAPKKQGVFSRFFALFQRKDG
jgi:hemerythrin-like metal-binding protein